MYECEVHNGVIVLLERLDSIIIGFALPLKEGHIKVIYECEVHYGVGELLEILDGIQWLRFPA